jgi:hypothetical protein
LSAATNCSGVMFFSSSTTANGKRPWPVAGPVLGRSENDSDGGGR